LMHFESEIDKVLVRRPVAAETSSRSARVFNWGFHAAPFCRAIFAG
jgi:hypothetical protein